MDQDSNFKNPKAGRHMAIFAYGPALPKSRYSTLYPIVVQAPILQPSRLLTGLGFHKKKQLPNFLYLRLSFLWELLNCKTS